VSNYRYWPTDSDLVIVCSGLLLFLIQTFALSILSFVTSVLRLSGIF
jgi:hypothetical protein